jgi:hypothetical protein
MQITVGNRTVNLSQSDFVASGGEASVYAKDRTAYKIYTDPGKTLPSKKMSELSLITSPNIIRPMEQIFSGKSVVGYTMRYLPSTYALCQLFTKAFRDRNGVTNSHVLKLVKSMREGVQHCHEKGILIVDLNEMNLLTDQAFGELYFIDVDSYQTPSFHATALMDSVRDRHSKTFSEGTDWFSFAVVSFQLFIGIHPYRGKHPAWKSMDERMLHNLSVLNKSVSIPPVCQPFTVIPQAYLDWYTTVFEKGERTAPPLDFLVPVITLIPVLRKGLGKVLRKTLDDLPHEIREFLFTGGTCYYLTDESLVGLRTVNGHFKGHHLVWAKKPYVVGLENGTFFVADGETGQRSASGFVGQDLVWGNGIVLLKNEDKLVEIGLLPNGTPYALSVHNVLPKATKCFQGCAIQDMFGTCQAMLFPKPRTCWPLNVKELKGCRIIDAKFQANSSGTTGVFAAIGFTGKRYDRVTVIVTASESRVFVDEDVAEREVNFALLDSLICVMALGEQKARVFKAVIGAKSSMEVDDDWSGVLWAAGDRLLAADGKVMEHLSLAP